MHWRFSSSGTTAWIRWHHAGTNTSRIFRTVSANQQAATCCKSGLQYSSANGADTARRPTSITLRRVFVSPLYQLTVRHPSIGPGVLRQNEGRLRQKPRPATPLVLNVAVQMLGVCRIPQVRVSARRSCRCRLPRYQRSDVSFPAPQTDASSSERPSYQRAVPGSLLPPSLSMSVRLEKLSAPLQRTCQQGQPRRSRRCSKKTRTHRYGRRVGRAFLRALRQRGTQLPPCGDLCVLV
jgi:hypothetical protein